MIADAHTRRDQIDNLTYLGTDTDRVGHICAASATTQRWVHDRFVRVTSAKMRARRPRLFPRITASRALLGSTHGTLLPRTHPIS